MPRPSRWRRRSRRSSATGSSGPSPRRSRTERSAGSTGGLLRSDYARILDRVRRDGPDVRALDVIFRTAGDPAEDRQLQSAIRRSGHALVLPYDEGNLRVLREADGDPTARALLFG